MKQLKIPEKEQFFQPCSHLDIITRVLRNLEFSFVKIGDDEHTVYVFGSEYRRIIINGIEFTDYFEILHVDIFRGKAFRKGNSRLCVFFKIHWVRNGV